MKLKHWTYLRKWIRCDGMKVVSDYNQGPIQWAILPPESFSNGWYESSLEARKLADKVFPVECACTPNQILRYEIWLAKNEKAT